MHFGDYMAISVSEKTLGAYDAGGLMILGMGPMEVIRRNPYLRRVRSFNFVY